MRAFLTLWVALALWLVPATVERRAPGGGMRSLDASEHVSLEAIRLPERLVTTVHGAGLLPLRVDGASPSLAVPADARRDRLRARATVRAAHDASRAVARPRRLVFPTEALAPPPARS